MDKRYELTPEEKAKAGECISWLIGILIKRGISEGCESDYEGGSYADDLRFLSKSLSADLLNDDGRGGRFSGKGNG